jgi:CRISPR/Cas system CSM-associated protein Csm5 (group 7 of RAMP superfamily)
MEHKIEVESITPVHIGSGRDYPIFSIIDGKRFDDGAIFERFADSLMDNVKNTNIDDFLNFLKNSLENEIAEFSIRNKDKLTPLYNIDEIDSSVKSNENKLSKVYEIIKYVDGKSYRPFIPASTIKGLFLTIWFYKNLLNKEKELNRIIWGKIKGENNKEIEVYRILQNPNLIEIYKEGLKSIFGENPPEILISDCYLSQYKIKIGRLFFGSEINRNINIEVLDDFKGSFTIIPKIEEIKIGEYFASLNDFTRKYLENLKRMKELDRRSKSKVDEISNELNKIKENEAIVVLGKYTNLYSKTILSAVPEYLSRRFRVRRPRILKHFAINGNIKLIGFVKMRLL